MRQHGLKRVRAHGMRASQADYPPMRLAFSDVGEVARNLSSEMLQMFRILAISTVFGNMFHPALYIF